MKLLKKLVIACVIIFSSLSVSSANSAQLKSIEIFNVSSLQNDYFINMAKYAEEQMASLAANTIVIVYPIGRFLTGENPKNNSTSFRGASHEVVLTETQVNKINLRAELGVFIVSTAVSFAHAIVDRWLMFNVMTDTDGVMY